MVAGEAAAEIFIGPQCDLNCLSRLKITWQEREEQDLIGTVICVRGRTTVATA